MKKLLLGMTLILALIVGLAPDSSAANVRGYYRKDGTYVQPYIRSNPDGNPYNNYGYPGNYNPNTGQISPGDPGNYLERYYRRSYQPPYTPGIPQVPSNDD